MGRYKHYDYALTKMLPINSDPQTPPGKFEYTLNQLIEEKIDRSLLFSRGSYENERRFASAEDRS